MRWRSYDSVADLYKRVAEVRFSPLARDLIRAIAPRRNEVLLDVGCGTGLASRCILESCRPDLIVGVDPSPQMLRHATRLGALRVVAAAVPGLPFTAHAFDAVFANLVLSHITDVELALVELRTVLQSDGRITCSAWGHPEPAGPENQQREASEIIDDVRARHGLMVDDDRAWPVPWEDRFREGANLHGVFASAGFADVRVTAHLYRHSIPVDVFTAGTEWGARGRYLRDRADDDVWSAVRGQIVDRLRARFGENIEAYDGFWIASARRA